jgi:4-diphosphocytidyl-2-C-methyl-D-erythritol kinase
VCEPIVKKHYDAVAKALDWLAEYAPPRMTGTGACIFAPFDSQQQAQQVLTALPSDWQGFVAKGCNQSPLAQFLSTLEVEVTARC